MTTKPNSLTSKESFRLRTNVSIAPEGLTLEELRAWAQEQCGFTVTYANVRSACDDVGYEFTVKRNQSGKPKKDRVRVLASLLAQLYQECGVIVPSELRDIASAK